MAASSNRLSRNAGVLPSALVLIAALLTTHVGTASALNFNVVVNALSTPAPMQLPPTSSSEPSEASAVNAPTIRLSRASARGINALYAPQDPKTIPAGFIRMCGKAGGFAPGPVWTETTNGVTPWFENEDGCYIFFNCNDSRWYVDNAYGAGMYLANPDGSLLLPPTNGWVSLTGRRAGAPKMSFV
ncbi:hypothetical protein ACHAXT_011067 [Thalassiosira profunda]